MRREPGSVDAAIAALRRAEVRSERVAADVRSAIARARREEAQRRRPARAPWLLIPAAVAAGAVIAVAIGGGPPAFDPSLVRLPHDVWMHAGDGARIEVEPREEGLGFRLEEGTLGVRLVHRDDGSRPRRVEVRAGELTVTAKGTIFSVSRRDGETAVFVSEGVVEAREGPTRVDVPAGRVYAGGEVRRAESMPPAHRLLAALDPGPDRPPGARPAEDAASRRAEPPPAEEGPDEETATEDPTPGPIDGGVAAARPPKPASMEARGPAAPPPGPRAPSEGSGPEARSRRRPGLEPEAASPPATEARSSSDAGSGAPHVTPDSGPAEPSGAPPRVETIALADRWRRARGLAADGRLEAAISAYGAIAMSGDPVWVPLARLELARLHERRGAKPRAAREAAELLRRHPDHALAPEARALLCRVDPSRDLCEVERSDASP